MSERLSLDYQRNRYVKVFWKDRPRDCPNCLGLEQVAMTKPDHRGDEQPFWAPCPCCVKTIEPLPQEVRGEGVSRAA